MVGTLEDARHAASGIATPFADGCSRDAFLIRGVVYKIENGSDDSEDANSHEWENYKRIRSLELPHNAAVPPTELYHVDGIPVIAMEYINGKSVGECYCIPGDDHSACISQDIIDELSKVTGITDFCYGNLILRDGTLYIVDLEY